MKRFLSMILSISILFAECFVLVPKAEAATEYMSAADARNFLAFVYNSNTEQVTYDALSDDIYYKLLTGQYAGDSTYELGAKAAFLSFMDARIIQTLNNANVAVKTSSDYLIDYFTNALDDESPALVTDIYKDNVAKSILALCEGELVLELVDKLSNAVEKPAQYIDDVKAISSAFAYTYGQNVVSLYTYFDAALSCVYLKSTEGAYETAMSYNISALKDSNFMSFAVKLIPGITSWEEWIEDMDYWAEYVHNMRGDVVAGKTGESYVVVFNPNCDELDVKVNWYAQGELMAPVMEREGYVLEGWYFDEECTMGPVQDGYVVTENLVLYAKWVDRYFTICFDSNCSEAEDYTYELDRLNVDWYEPVMKRPGYIFKGWYRDSACTNPVMGEFEVTGDMTFYAGWDLQYTYTVSNGKAQLISVKSWEYDDAGNMITDMLIPETAGGYPVESVDVSDWDLVITGITFSDSVERVVDWSFSYAKKLKNVVLGNGITVIEEGAFNQCSALESITFTNALRTIEAQAFSGCSKLPEIDLPEGLVTIGNSAFSGCSSVTEVVIPDSVVTIGDTAFRSCTGLKKITIGKNVSSLGKAIFEYCDSLEEISVSPDNPYYTSVDGVLYNKDKTILYKYPTSKNQTSFTMPETVEQIADGAFADCSKLEEINMNSNVKVIGAKSFYGCNKLKSILIPDGVKSIADYVFYDCKSLTEVTIPDSVTSIGMDAFENCEAITALYIPESVESIGEYAFYNCNKLKEIRLPSKLTALQNSVFGNCKSLESIEIPSGVIDVGFNAFGGCESLTEILLPDSVTTMWGGTFMNCKKLEKIRIPDGIQSIYYYTFYGCESLKQVILPKSVTYIDFDNFSACPSLTDVYYTGTESEWGGVYINEYGNECLNDADIHYNCSVVAEISKAEYKDGQIKGQISFDYLNGDSDFFVGLYDGDTFVDIVSVSAEKGAESTDFAFVAGSGKDYGVKAFFWNIGNLSPKGRAINSGVTIN